MKGLPLITAMLALGLTLLLGGGSVAAGTPFPLPEAKGTQCVETPEVMRRTHMDLLKHQRDETMRAGARDGQHSLKGCIDCHAVPDADGRPVGIDSDKHFCRVCHDYAAVRSDCFECHASTPEAQPQAAGAQSAAR